MLESSCSDAETRYKCKGTKKAGGYLPAFFFAREAVLNAIAKLLGQSQDRLYRAAEELPLCRADGPSFILQVRLRGGQKSAHGPGMKARLKDAVDGLQQGLQIDLSAGEATVIIPEPLLTVGEAHALIVDQRSSADTPKIPAKPRQSVPLTSI